MPNGRCRLHGGKTPAGIAASQFKHGRYSKHLPSRLQERYQDALLDRELLSLREEIALVDARLADLLDRVDTGEAGSAWSSMAEAYKALTDAIRAQDNAVIPQAMAELQKRIYKGTSDYAAWDEVQTIIEQRRKLVESERRRLVEMQQVITAEGALALIAALVDIVRKHVADRGILGAISADLTRLVAARPGGGSEPRAASAIVDAATGAAD